MVRMNVKAFLELQGDISDAAFARKLGVSRSQLWRVRTEKSAVGVDFIEKFMLSYPEKSVNDYFYVEFVPSKIQTSVCGTKQGNFFARSVPQMAQKYDSDKVVKQHDSVDRLVNADLENKGR